MTKEEYRENVEALNSAMRAIGVGYVKVENEMGYTTAYFVPVLGRTTEDAMKILRKVVTASPWLVIECRRSCWCVRCIMNWNVFPEGVADNFAVFFRCAVAFVADKAKRGLLRPK